MSKTHLFTISESKTQHDDNDSSWECRFVIGSLYDFGNVHFNTMWNQTGRKATNSILLLTLAPRFICGTKMKFDQMNLEVLFPAIAIRSEVIRTHKAVLFLWEVHWTYFCKPQFLPPWASSL